MDESRQRFLISFLEAIFFVVSFLFVRLLPSMLFDGFWTWNIFEKKRKRNEWRNFKKNIRRKLTHHERNDRAHAYCCLHTCQIVRFGLITFSATQYSMHLLSLSLENVKHTHTMLMHSDWCKIGIFQTIDFYSNFNPNHFTRKERENGKKAQLYTTQYRWGFEKDR